MKEILEAMKEQPLSNKIFIWVSLPNRMHYISTFMPNT